MKNLLWIIDNNLEKHHKDSIVKALEKYNIEHIIVSDYALNKNDLFKRAHYQLLIYGQIKFIDFYQKYLCNFELLNDIEFYQYNPEYPSTFFRQYYWLNSWNLLMTKYLFCCYFSDDNQLEKIFKNEKKVFVKPDSSKKEFTGFVLDRDNKEIVDFIEKDLKYLDWDSEIVISQFRDIELEFRFIVKGHTIITGDCYRSSVNYSLYKYNDENNEAKNWLQSILNKFKHCKLPNQYICVDVAQLKNNEFRVIEINAFNCCGLYDCNVDKIIRSFVE